MLLTHALLAEKSEFADNLGPGLELQNVGPDLDPNQKLTILGKRHAQIQKVFFIIF